MTDKIFIQNFERLENIFGRAKIASREVRLKEIFHSTESSWEKNLDRLKNKKIKHILIGEAAPWSECGTPRYFYNQIESRYHRRIWRAFFPNTTIPTDNEKAFNMVADSNFLLIDTLPFSMKYTGKRNHSDYFAILANSVAWWTEKLNSEKLKFDKKLNVAFAFKVNGRSIIRATGGQLKLKGGQTVNLTEDNIAADGSGFTNSGKLRLIYQL